MSVRGSAALQMAVILLLAVGLGRGAAQMMGNPLQGQPQAGVARNVGPWNATSAGTLDVHVSVLLDRITALNTASSTYSVSRAEGQSGPPRAHD